MGENSRKKVVRLLVEQLKNMTEEEARLMSTFSVDYFFEEYTRQGFSPYQAQRMAEMQMEGLEKSAQEFIAQGLARGVKESKLKIREKQSYPT